MMTLKDLGYHKGLDAYSIEHELDSFEIGRVIQEHRERYIVKTLEFEFDAELIGNLRFTAESRMDYPAVGDWVAISEFDDNKALIHAVYPRKSIIERQAVGKLGQTQIIATNIDVGIIMQAVDRDFNLNRLERYLTICNASKVEPVIVLSKIDLITASELEKIASQIQERIKMVPVFKVFNDAQGYIALKKIIKKGKTYCLLGSSGVGKSTLINNLAGRQIMDVGALSTSVNKGKHTTSHRELIVLDGGGVFIDNPGMREVGIADASQGLETTFDKLLTLADNCKYKDCSHLNELGCAVLEGLESGDLDEGIYQNYRKLQKEKMHFETDALERKKKDKSFGKLIKNIQKQRRNHKY